MSGNSLGGVAATSRHGRGDLLVQHTSALGRHLLVGRLLQQRMAEPEPLLLSFEQAGRHQVTGPALWKDRCHEVGIHLQARHRGHLQQGPPVRVKAPGPLPHRGLHDVRNQQQVTRP